MRLSSAKLAAAAGLYLFGSCKPKPPQVDALFYNATIYTVNSTFDKVTAFAVKDGRFVAVGSLPELKQKYPRSPAIDLLGAYVYPGFYDAHCHFVGLATRQLDLDLTGTTSWQEVLNRTVEYGKNNPQGWIIGRGWDQNDWPEPRFPENSELNRLFPNRPVLLKRIDGHAAIVNQYVLDLANITAHTQIAGGKIELHQGKPTGIVIDEALKRIEALIPPPDQDRLISSLLQAEQQCFSVGLTSLVDAGLTKPYLDVLDSLYRHKALRIRIYAMIADDEATKKHFFARGPYITDRFTIRSVKYYADGALGSRGALLLKPYSDQPSTTGISVASRSYLLEQARLCDRYGFQMCTHAIGDSANRLVLQVYAEILKEKNDKRWRVEHCQVIAPDDFGLFGQYNIVPSVQPVHATSDMYWALERLGVYRIKGAYAYRSLLKQNGWLAIGSDFPVEHINPLHGFYAAVVRKDTNHYPADGFLPEQALTREEALKGMTIWAARACFQEQDRGSIEPGKLADFTVLKQDLMSAPADSLFAIRVLATYVNGEQVYCAPDYKIKTN
ncbi:MAG: amidohydrolase [Chitinophagales bacterium]|nr:amidohydrolase [Chitinophagales bacterium]MDW8428422.1 amidohydrolase [Chitinophagales bacterium]